MRKISDISCRENQHTHFMCHNGFSKNHAVYEIMWKNIVEQGRPQMAIWCMRIACWIPAPTNTCSEYGILINFNCNNGCTNTPESYVIRTLPVLSTLAPDGQVWASGPSHFIPSTHWIQGWIDTAAGLDALKRQVFAPSGNCIMIPLLSNQSLYRCYTSSLQRKNYSAEIILSYYTCKSLLTSASQSISWYSEDRSSTKQHQETFSQLLHWLVIKSRQLFQLHPLSFSASPFSGFLLFQCKACFSVTEESFFSECLHTSLFEITLGQNS